MKERVLSLCYANNRTNKPIGKILEKEGVIYLIKSCRSRHFLRQPPAIAYDDSIILLAESYNVKFLIVTNSESKAKYRISLADFKEKSFKINRGFGPQLACTLENWDSTYTKNKLAVARRAIETPQIAETPKNIQPSLWDAGKVRNWIQPESFRIASLIS